ACPSDRASDLERRVRRADREDEVRLGEPRHRADVLEPGRLGPRSRLLAAPLGGPHDAVTLPPQHRADGCAHLPGVQQPDRLRSHYTATLTIVRLGGENRMDQREQKFLDYVQGGGQVE